MAHPHKDSPLARWFHRRGWQYLIIGLPYV